MDTRIIQMIGCEFYTACAAAMRAVRSKLMGGPGLFAVIWQPFRNGTVISILFCVCLCGIASAQVKSIGPVQSYQITEYGISGHTPMATFRVAVYNAHTIRITVQQDTSRQLLPYALVSNQLRHFKGFTVSSKGNRIEIATDSIDVRIDKSPSFRVVFYNKQGMVINEDAAGEGFGTTFAGHKASLYKYLQPGERFVAMGQALGPLDKRGMGFTLNNTDTYRYGDPRLSMYISIPFFMGIHQGLQYGIFSNNSYPTFFNFGLSTPQYASINMQGGAVDYFFMYDVSVANILKHYTAITGRMPLPPKWAIGYQQSRCSYLSQQEVAWVAQTFRQKQIPIDGIVLDADYQQDYRPFVTNKNRFPDLPLLSSQLAQQQIMLTASVYPGVAIDSAYHAYQSGLQQGVFVRYANGSWFSTEIAPVKCYLPDYTNPLTRSWWKHNMKWMGDNGIMGYWNDMNEPAIGGSYLPDNLVFDFDGRKAEAAEAKNVYGFQMARSSYEAALENTTNTRPFVLTRSGFAGVQRYSAVWSGDNTATDEGLMSSILLNSQMGLSGIAFCGHDIGGFIGDGSKELYIRWLQAGVFSPYCRNHKGCGGAAGEPWVYGAEAEAISKNYIGFRYQLLPYLYSAFYQATQTGLPVAQSLCIPYAHDTQVYHPSFQYQFLFGNDMLVAPVGSKEMSKQVYLPAGSWYPAGADILMKGGNTHQVAAPLHQLPIFIKSSAIIPLQQLAQSATAAVSDTLLLHVYYGNDANTFSYYEDDGVTLQYQQQDFFKRDIVYNPQQGTLTFTAASGKFASRFRHVTCIFHGFPASIVQWWVAGKSMAAQKVQMPLFNSLQWLQQVYEPGYFAAQTAAQTTGPLQQTISFSIGAAEKVLSWTTPND